MDLILCHQTTDFDALGAAVGLTRLKPGGKIVLTGGAHPTVKEFLALHRNALAIIERRSVDPEKISSLIIPDTQKQERLGKAAEWFNLPHLKTIEIYDHHLGAEVDIPATYSVIEPVGAATTLVVEQLQEQEIELTSTEATVMALGIHMDTGSLTFEQTTPRDAQALAWLMAQGANLSLIAEYTHPSLSPQLQQLLTKSLNNLHKLTIRGRILSWVLLKTETFIPGLSGLASELLKLTEADILLLAHEYGTKKSQEKKLTIIGRSRLPETDFNQLFAPLGGGGHGQAASVTLRQKDGEAFKLEELIEQLQKQIPYPLTARDLMSSPVRTIRPETNIEQAQRILLRYGHSGLCVVDEQDQLIGIISRRDMDIAIHHGFHQAPVKGYMSRNLKTVAPETTSKEIESLMVTYDVGRLPVLRNEKLIGIVTRTDMLRQRQGENKQLEKEESTSPIACFLPPNAQSLISQPILKLLDFASQEAQKRGWNLYLVGGAVRDLLLQQQNMDSQKQISPLQDIDLVVDSLHEAAEAGAGVELAKALQTKFPNCRLEVHGAFQTAALLWHNHCQFDNLWVDIATARTEFYPYPAANPVVEASSIRQDLYRRDFTINALALKLTNSKTGELLDFFGGLLDLQARQIRVLHPNSFIEDPTRIYRSVRFAVRLGFTIETQTEAYIRYAIASGVYERSQAENNSPPALTTRLKAELKYILQAPYWKPALLALQSLEALHCLHPQLKLTKELWREINLLNRWLRKLDPDNSLNHWLMRLELILTQLPGETSGKVATNLQLPTTTVQRLQNLPSVERKIVEEFQDNFLAPSQVVKLLQRYKLETLALLAVKIPRSIRKQVWCYVAHWRNIEAPLNGNDLKDLGYQPGPQYRQILEDLLMARLDGKISDRAEAEDYLRINYS